MATENGRENPRLNEQLFRAAHRFDFFQAVRLLERVFLEQAQDDPRRRRHAVGREEPPEREVVRFRALPSLSFPAGSISELRPPAAGAAANGEGPPPEMSVAFLGLVGPSGVLPHHYTTLLLQRIRDKDYALRDFLDLFHHRLISFFYRAWEKYRLPFAYERCRIDPPDDGMDPATGGLYALVGLGTAGLRGRLEVDDEAFLFYSGHFAHYPRSAVALECLLGDYFEMPVRVEQLQGRWLYLEPGDRSLMPSAEQPGGRNNRLAMNVTVGPRVWDVQSKFRVRVGPLTYAQFRRLMPNGDGLRPLCQLTRSFVGLEFDFDVQAVLLPGEVPPCRLASPRTPGSHLGWNAWVRNRQFTIPVDDAVFSLKTI